MILIIIVDSHEDRFSRYKKYPYPLILVGENEKEIKVLQNQREFSIQRDEIKKIHHIGKSPGLKKTK